MAIKAPTTGALIRATAIHANFYLANREAIETEIERLIELLDAVDGDVDLELEPDGGIEDEPQDEEETLHPAYGVNQVHGPTNRLRAYREWQAAQIGAVPNGRGGWRLT